MKKTIMFVVSLLTLGSVFAYQDGAVIVKDYNPPQIRDVTATTAAVSLPPSVLSGLTQEERVGVYFEYTETNKVCIAIYPTPASCLPKKTQLGQTEVTLTSLTPKTSYTVKFKKDNTVRCITTPCPENGFESKTSDFVTKQEEKVKDEIKKSLGYRSRGEQVSVLQNALIARGYLEGEATGFFGVMTLKAVKDFQRDSSIVPTGFVGPLTRNALNILLVSSEVVTTETFEGIVTDFSTACFADGECSVTVDGKKVVTTIGWSRDIVGKLLGVDSIGDLDKKIGSRAKVYAKKTADGYTLYGSKAYYVRVLSSVTTSKPSSKMSFFITSKNPGNGGNLGGLSGADAYCTALATSSGVFGKTWSAYLSATPYDGAAGINAKDRIGNGPWYNYDGTLIASTLEELHGVNNLNKKTALTETGEQVLGRGDVINVHDVLTGSDAMGLFVSTSTDTTCSNWTAATSGAAYVGHHDRIGINDSPSMKSWNSSHLSRGCGLPALRTSGGAGLFYCFAKN